MKIFNMCYLLERAIAKSFSVYIVYKAMPIVAYNISSASS